MSVATAADGRPPVTGARLVAPGAQLTAPGARIPAPGAEEPWLADGPGLAEDPWWAEDPEPSDAWLDEDLWLEGDPDPEDPERVAAWLERELAAAARWLAEDPEWADPGPAPREVLKAGRWDRTHGDGGGFAAGGLADHLPPGPVLAGLAGDRWADGLGALSDDELIGILRAARRLAS